MKKLLSILSLVLVFSLALTPLCYAAEANTDTLADWDVRVTVPEGCEAVLKGREYYIYAQKTGSIPCVMLTTYKYDSEEAFIPDFTAYMQRQYADLEVTAEAERKSIGGKACYEIDYGYTVSGYEVRDRRVVMTRNGLTYMFVSKEVEEKGMTIGDMLEQVVADCVFLSEQTEDSVGVTGLEESPGLAGAYLYCLEDGMPKYWMDFTGTISDNPVLHCYFRSSDPTFYESCYILDLETAERGENSIDFRKISDGRGFDHSDCFPTMRLEFEDEQLTLVVERDEKTLAGGTEDNVLTGEYAMYPVGASLAYEYLTKDGLLKYWLEILEGEIRLHAMFRSGDPEYYEEVFSLDPETAEVEGDYTVRINKVYNSAGEDVSHWFKTLTLTEVQGAVLMKVVRDTDTLAGGGEDNILSDVYLLEPHPYLRPRSDGPYTEEELGRWAQIYYFTREGFYPPEAEVLAQKDGTYSIQLFETVKQGRVSHTATSAWYTVDACGNGTDEIYEREVRLCGSSRR